MIGYHLSGAFGKGTLGPGKTLEQIATQKINGSTQTQHKTELFDKAWLKQLAIALSLVCLRLTLGMCGQNIYSLALA